MTIDEIIQRQDSGTGLDVSGFSDGERSRLAKAADERIAEAYKAIKSPESDRSDARDAAYLALQALGALSQATTEALAGLQNQHERLKFEVAAIAYAEKNGYRQTK